MKTFVPRTLQVPSRHGVAVVRMAPRSDPASGSVRHIVPVHSPVTIRSRNGRCSGPPCRLSSSTAPRVSIGQSEKAGLAAAAIPAWWRSACSMSSSGGAYRFTAGRSGTIVSIGGYRSGTFAVYCDLDGPAASDPPVVALPELLPQLPLHDLSVGVLRQDVAELEAPRLLVAGQVRQAGGQKVVRPDRLPVVDADDGVHRFTPVFVGNPDHGAFGDRRMGQQQVFDFPWVDVVSPAHHHVLRTVEDIEVTAVVDLADVARVEPTAAQR